MPRVLSRRTQKPLSWLESFQNVTGSIRPEMLSMGVLRSGAMAFIWAGSF